MYSVTTERVQNWNFEEVKAHLNNELKYNSVIGHFDSSPFIKKVSDLPLNTRDKKDSIEEKNS